MRCTCDLQCRNFTRHHSINGYVQFFRSGRQSRLMRPIFSTFLKVKSQVLNVIWVSQRKRDSIIQTPASRRESKQFVRQTNRNRRWPPTRECIYSLKFHYKGRHELDKNTKKQLHDIVDHRISFASLHPTQDVVPEDLVVTPSASNPPLPKKTHPVCTYTPSLLPCWPGRQPLFVMLLLSPRWLLLLLAVQLPEPCTSTVFLISTVRNDVVWALHLTQLLFHLS